MNFDEYSCDGQMNIFDFIEGGKQETVCSQRDQCDAYPNGCGGTIEPCRFGGAFHWNNAMNPPE